MSISQLTRWAQSFQPRNKLAKSREKYLAQHSLPQSLEALISAPLPELSDDLFMAKTLVLDIETTGLDPANDHILSLGWLDVTKGAIELDSAKHHYIQTPDAIKPETAVINHIVPEMLLNDGADLDEIMTVLFEGMRGRVLVAHGVNVEKQFIDYYVQRRFQLPPLPLLWIDTLAIDKSLCINKDTQQCGDFRLGACRDRHGLPPYQQHSALVDALATGELYLAQLKRFKVAGETCLKHVPIV